jgi:hypothetical protein
MRTIMQILISRRLLMCVTVATLCAVSGPWVSGAYAQERQAGGRDGGRFGRGRQAVPPGQAAEGGIAPAELQELMDAMVVMRAERELQLSDDQFPQFLTRLKGLQAIRRRAENQRNRALMELRRLVQAANADGVGAGSPGSPGSPDDGQIRDRLKALDDAEAQALAEIRQARATLEQVLNIRQQARFRLLEVQIERRKLELFARSRQPNPPQ